jgi:Holliday junction DNA helicase RuvA
MIEYIKGQIQSLTPASVVLENNGIGYLIHISLNTFSSLQEQSACCLYIYEVIREDAHQLFGFFRTEERDLFLLLIGVSGVGANTARLMLSSMTVEELRYSVIEEKTAALQSIKGIGLRIAQRIIVELKDKVEKTEGMNKMLLTKLAGNDQVRHEAVAALQMLGFPLHASQKVVNQLLYQTPQMPVEQVVKAALKLL